MRKMTSKPYRIIVSFFLALVISLGFVSESAQVLAIPDLPFYSGNDILYYDPDDFGSCASGGGSLSGTTTKEKIWNYLLQQGLSENQAAGLMGNMQKESTFSPTVHQDPDGTLWDDGSGKGWGLVQWDGGRRFTSPDGGILGKLRKDKPELEKYTDKKYSGAKEPGDDFPVEDFDALLLFELEYMKKESEKRNVTANGFSGSANKEWERMKQQSSLREATLFWERNFEVSGDIDHPERLELRVEYAQGVLDELGGTTSSGRADDASCVAGTEFDQLVAAYAWPDHQDYYVEKKPEYETAVTQAKDDRRYTGDGCFGGGVDCGAFTTLLITNSGHDPEFNHGGEISRGAGNTVNQQDWADTNWEKVENIVGSDNINVADLRAGDVAFSPGHTFVFVGDVEGFETQIASASQCGRAPMEGLENPTAGNVVWYRKK